MQQVPAWLMVPLMVIVGPFVEEYVFRHLLIGKLSRRVNIWICCALSVVLFAALHIVGQERSPCRRSCRTSPWAPSWCSCTCGPGRNLMFSYFVHASKNLLAVDLHLRHPAGILEQLQQVQG